MADTVRIGLAVMTKTINLKTTIKTQNLSQDCLEASHCVET